MLNEFGRFIQKLFPVIGKRLAELSQTNSDDGEILTDVVVQAFGDAVLFLFASLVEFASQFLEPFLVLAIFFERRLQLGNVFSDARNAKRRSAWSRDRKRFFVEPAYFSVRPDDAVFDIPTISPVRD